MRLHDALRKAVREYGVRVIAEKRLLYILSDFRAFEEYPAMRQVLGSIAEEEYGKELVRLFLDDETDWCLSYAQNLRKSLSEKKRFREDLATYAVDSILFGLGLVNSVTEPSDHGFDPMDHSSTAGNGGAGAGARQPGAPQTGGAQAPGTAGQGAGAAPGGGAAPSGNDGNGPSFRMKWLAAAVLLAGGFAFGWAVSNTSGLQNPSSLPQTSGGVLGRTAVQGKAGIQSGDSARNNAESGRHEKNGTSQQSGLSAYEPEKAYYLDLQTITVGPDEVQRLRKSAEQGNALAQNNLGVMYAEGKGVSKDNAEAVKWFRKSAGQGNSAGEANLGKMFARGIGVSRDYAEAMKWYRRSAEQGDSVSQFLIGLDYAVGAGGTKDQSEAAKWFRKAAEQGNADAQASLGGMYLTGSGVTKDYDEALKWSWKSAWQGNDHGEFNLGEIYDYGFGVNRDKAEALKWYTKAAAHGNILAESVIMDLDKSNSVQPSGSDAGRTQGGDAADDHPGGVSIFGRKVYLRGEFDDCPWDKLYDRCLIRRVAERVYMATAYMKVDWAPYKFKFAGAAWAAGSNFGYAPESTPGVYDFASGTPIRLNPNSVFEEIKVTPPHDGLYDFYLDVSGDVPVTYIREHR